MPAEMSEVAKDHHVIPFLLPGMQTSLSALQLTLGERGIGYEVYMYESRSRIGVPHGKAHFICIPEARLPKENLDAILSELHLN